MSTTFSLAPFAEIAAQLGFHAPGRIESMFDTALQRLEANDPSLAHVRDRTSFSTAVKSCKQQSGQCYYHLTNLSSYEAVISGVLSRHANWAPRNVKMSFAVQKLDYEFHACSISTRTLLDYIARATFAFFNLKGHSFRDHAKALRSRSPRDAAQRVSAVLNQNWPWLSGYYGTNHSALRDRILHLAFVGTGQVTVTGGANITAQSILPTVAAKDLKPVGLGPANVSLQRLVPVLKLSNEIFVALEQATMWTAAEVQDLESKALCWRPPLSRATKDPKTKQTRD